jgi:hypothetical protein
MKRFRSTLNCSLRAAGFAALSSLIGPVFAEPPAASDVAPITELPDGSLVTYGTSAGVVVRAHYTHQAKLVASNCLSLESRRVGIHDTEPTLVNNCAYATAVSYCIDDMDAGARACDAVGHRKAESHRIEPRAAIAIQANAAWGNADLDWVACKADTTKTSTLIANGTRGECLGTDGSVQTASIETG